MGSLMREDLKANDRVDGFVIEKELFQGGMARIYKARDILTDEMVALKMPHGDILNNPVQFYHYQNEERIGRLLNHPHIVRFFYRNRTFQYIIQEYIEGRELRRIIGKGRKMTFADARPIILQVADGLSYLHAAKIVHLDLKPENIILTSDKQIKIIDFGFANCDFMPDLLGEDFAIPHGTPYYIAPEQIIGVRDDPRSDIYSVGVMLYEMLTGRLPFRRSDKLSVTRRRLRIEPVPPRYYEPDLDPRQQEIILKCLARDPDNRYEHVAALIDALHNIDHVPITDRGRQHRIPWRNYFPFLSAPLAIPKKEKPPAVPSGKKQILGAIIDDDSADLVVEELRRRALILDSDVTLLTVLEEEDDSHYIKYGLQVAGERFRTRLERYIQRFRRYNIDPTVRLVRGHASDAILDMARRLRAALVILGPSRKPALRAHSVMKKVSEQEKVAIIIAATPSQPPAWSVPGMAPEELNEEQVLAIDLFLIDSWFHHVTWLADLAVSVLQDHEKAADITLEPCMIGRWLESLDNDRHWRETAAAIAPVHGKLHRIAEQLIQRARLNDMDGVKILYNELVLPYSCELRTTLAMVSRKIREASGNNQVRYLPALHGGSCPLLHSQVPVGGPLLELHAIRNFFARENRTAKEENKS
jgi:serine/threonine protein kinase